MALELSDKTPAQQVVLLDRLREQAGVDEALLLSSGGNVIASASKGVGKLLPDMPEPHHPRQARQAAATRALEGEPEQGLRLRVLVPVAALSIAEDERLLQLLQPVPPTLARDAETVQEVYRDYQELSLSRQGLKQIYILTLTLTLLLALFSAIALAFVLSARACREPLVLLADGTQAVARGRLQPARAVTSSDELGVLTQSFNSMTEPARRCARAAESRPRRARDAPRPIWRASWPTCPPACWRSTTELRLRAANHGASAILQDDLDGLEGRDAGRLAAAAAAGRGDRRRFRRPATAPGSSRLELADAHVLLVRGSALPRGERRRLRRGVRRHHPAGCRRSAPPPGAKWRGAWRTKSRIRSRRSSSPPSACRPSSRPSSRPSDARHARPRHRRPSSTRWRR